MGALDPVEGLGPVLGLPLSIAMGVLGALQIANAEGAMQRALEAETGGYVGGNTHAFGGTNINAQKGEYIVNAGAMSNPVVAASVIRANTIGNNNKTGVYGFGKLEEIEIARIAAQVVGSIPVTNNTRDVELINNRVKKAQQRAYVSV